MQQIMTTFLTYLTHVLIIVGMVALIYFVQLMIREESNILEKILRTASAMTGFLIYFGAKGLGISIPSLMMRAVTITNPITFGFFGLLLPSAAGLLVAWYCLRAIRRSEDVARRTIVLLVAFMVTMFADVYAATYGTVFGEPNNARALLPNVTFTVALSLYVILNYKNTAAKKRT